MQFLSYVATALVALVSVVSSQTPGACTGACQGVAHDPCVILRVSDGTYFRFSTGNRINIASAPSISGPWNLQGSAIPAGSKIAIDGRNDLWAPDVHGPYDGWYYLYYAVSTFGSQVSAIGVARSQTMDQGTWEDLGATGISSKVGSPYNAIDPNLIQTPTGFVMTFGSFWGDLYQVAMENPPTKVAAGATPKQVILNPAGPRAVEGGFAFQNGGFYYIFFSVGSCCGYDTNRPAAGKEYATKVCRSTQVNGPYVDQAGNSCMQGGGMTVVQSHSNMYGPGGESVFQDPTLGSIIVYHYVDTNIGFSDGQKRFGWNVLNWVNGWPVAVSA
ncbi:putative arabinan endo-1,5-alpha-L-arabinosidase A [Wilcoxina mikolae CBS 423.85]|nr:putative arabinan endo-1,5-alpha-L-arabinosidase A [Wilcoxina mikolae CBS 423.85]